MLNKLKKTIYLAGITIIANCTLLLTHCHAQWVQQNLPINATVNDVHFINENTGLVGTLSPQRLLRTTDGGNNWISLADSIVYRFEFPNDSIGYGIGYNGVNFLILKTVNGGLNWIQKFVSGQILHGMSFVNKDTGWVCGGESGGKIWRTTNGGENFILQYQTSEVDVIGRIFFLKEQVNGNYKGWWSSYGKLKVTTNGGQNWGATINLPEPYTLYKFEFINADTGFMTFGSKEGKFYRTINGGLNWISSDITFPGTSHDLFIDFSVQNNGNIIYATGGNRIYGNPSVVGLVFKSTNSGVNWGYQDVDTQSLQIWAYEKIEFINENTGWVYYRQKGYKTTNGGGTIVSINYEQTTINNNYELYQNYPNPFNPNTSIKFTIPVNRQMSSVSLKVYNILGKEVLKIYENQKLESGNYKASIDFTSLNLPSGVYFYTLQISTGSNNFIKTLKMSYVK
jgi:photosystem II stability/assembly factor-like uncharacterized protein